MIDILRTSDLRVDQIRIGRRIRFVIQVIDGFDQMRGGNRANQLRKTFANAGIDVDIDAFHIPLHVEKPFGTRCVGNVFSERMHEILSAGDTAGVESSVQGGGRKRWFPVFVGLLEIFGETKAEAFE